MRVVVYAVAGRRLESQQLHLHCYIQILWLDWTPPQHFFVLLLYFFRQASQSMACTRNYDIESIGRCFRIFFLG